MTTISQGQSTWQRPPVTTGLSESSNSLTPGKASSDDEFKFFGEDGLTFSDFIDVINPLQHIPVVSTLYRQLTGDEMDPGSRIAGGTLFFGPVGTAISGVNVMLEHNTGKDMGDHVMAMLDDGDPAVPLMEPDTQLQHDQSNDLVTSWARAELAFRAEEAKKQGIDPGHQLTSIEPTVNPEQKYNVNQMSLHTSTYSNQITAASMYQAAPKPLSNPEIIPSNQVDNIQQAPDAAAVLAALGIPNTAWPETQKTENNNRANRQNHNPQPTFIPSQPEIMTTRTNAQPGQIAGLDKQGRWFSSSMGNALDKYQQKQPVNGPITANTLNILN